MGGFLINETELRRELDLFGGTSYQGHSKLSAANTNKL